MQNGEPTSVADALSDQFYRWELRGRGWLIWDEPVDLEPPFRPFEGHSLAPKFFGDDGLQETALSRLTDGFLKLLGKPSNPPVVYDSNEEIEEPRPEPLGPRGELVELQIHLPDTYQPSGEVMAQCLFSLCNCRAALAFEVAGDSEGLVAQVVAELKDAEQAFAQVKAHFPDAVLQPVQGHLASLWQGRERTPTTICEFGLEREFMLPLLCASDLPVDPLVGVCGAMEYLQPGESAVFQVLFQPARKPWVENIWQAVLTDSGDSFFENMPDLPKYVREKLGSPLFSVVVRVAAKSSTEDKTWDIIKRIGGALKPFANQQGNQLVLLENENYSDAGHEDDLLNRCSRRLGMLLNSEELVSLVHLPTAAVRSRKLKRSDKRTKKAPAIATGPGLLLGENSHEGKIIPIALKPQHRMQHMHIIGASGQGKSCLLLNLICQDIYSGGGVAVLDPHGDLIDQVMGYIPAERYKDVVLFDPSDDEFPVGFNILSAHTELEKTLLASDLVGVFRRLSSSWGDQMEAVLGNAILAFLESSKGGTLADLRRFLVEVDYRREFLATVQDPEIVYYWEKDFPLLKSANSVGPLLTRLNAFLRPKAIRYVVAQRQSKLDFAAIMNEGKIFLAKLPHGLIGQENASLMGALLVAKIHQSALSRQHMEVAERRPFFIFIDEFQHFATPSVAEVLSGVRKYQLGLVLAHHQLAQIRKSEELYAAITTHPYTRICFRVGDDDAVKLSQGFSFFEPRDLQNLSPGEAICRVERAEYDFNLHTSLPPELDENAAERQAYLKYLTRLHYGTPRAEVEKELAESRAEPPPERTDPFTKRATKAKQAAPASEPESPPKAQSEASSPSSPPPVEVPPPPRPRPAAGPPAVVPPTLGGKGGPEHQRWQKQIRLVAEQRGWTSQKEDRLGVYGDVDVLLRKGQFAVACEISFNTPAGYEVRSIGKRLGAGVSFVVVMSPDAPHLAKIERIARDEFGSQVGTRVHFIHPTRLGEWLDMVDANQGSGEEVIGEARVSYRAKVVSEDDHERRQDRLRNVFKRWVNRMRRKPPEA